MIRTLMPMLAALTAVSLAWPGSAAPARGLPPSWIATWAASPQAAEPDPDEPLAALDGQTVRERVRVSIGGSQLRIRLSNEVGAAPLTVGSATVAIANDPASVKVGSLRPLTFGGRTSVTIPAGAPFLSDPVALPVSPGAEISISLFFPQRVASPTLHSLALKRAVVSPRGDFTGQQRLDIQATSSASISVTAVLVPAKPSHSLVAAVGDSITDGAGSTEETDRSWPARFAQRVAKAAPTLAVVNAGIAGNQLAHEGYGASALARFDRDVLALPGVTHVVLMEGINDLAAPGVKLGGRYMADPSEVRTSEDVIAAYQQLIGRAHARGVKVIGATLTPFEGVSIPGFYSEAKEVARQGVNSWIRTSGAFDGVIDFDAVLRDPEHPGRLQPRYAARDRLHPNDAGYEAMAEAIDLKLFRSPWGT
jgi:lysophospholipase L1-like esterase